MRYRRLHGTDLEISELGFGTWTVSTGWWGTYSDAEAERLVRRALELRPDTGAFLDSLGWIHFQRGDYPLAVEVLERAAEWFGC